MVCCLWRLEKEQSFSNHLNSQLKIVGKDNISTKKCRSSESIAECVSILFTKDA